MKYCLSLLICLLAQVSFSQTYYIVRHAEKVIADSSNAMMKNDPPLTTAGQERAAALAKLLKKKHIVYIFATPTNRTRTTAMALANVEHITIELYGPKPDNGFFQKIRSLDKNVLIVGHSNTVDDIVNNLIGQEVLKDLGDNEYDNLFLVQHKGNAWSWKQRKYGKKVDRP